MVQTDINILMMGETGVGKSTFINAFANYLIYNTLHEAMLGEMQALIPITFHVTDPESADFQSKTIFVGNRSDNEECVGVGQSSTQMCHSYLFPIGNRLLRLIDAPGVGDVRGVEQDKKNCDHILSYLHAYEHLNGICVLLKPNNERLTVGFRFCFKEILTHLHINAKDNLMFIFTNGRTTFYQPGSTAPLLRQLISELNNLWKVEVPFNRGNTFVFDNEAFRFLASHKNGIPFSEDEINNFNRSWQKSVEEFARLIRRVLKCQLHAVRDSLSINDAQQLIRLLSRPIGETARLIQENIQLAQKYKQDALKNLLFAVPKQMPQLNGKMISFDYPRTVCTNSKCTETILVDSRRKMNYKTHCHPQCYLRDVERECIGHSILQYCTAINQRSSLCQVCQCHWREHMHVSYEYQTYITHVDLDRSSTRSLSRSIDKRIEDLKKEEASLVQTCSELSQFVKQNAITPYNDDILEYIKYFIREEEIKRSVDNSNEDVINGLKQMVVDYEQQQKLFDGLLQSSAASSTATRIHSSEDVFGIVAELYSLPINGASIRQQIEGLKQTHLQGSRQKEHKFQTPRNIVPSTIMQQLQQIVN